MAELALKVRDYMVREVVTARPDTEITRVVNLLIENDISGVVVVDGQGAVAGIVTERDCIDTAVHSGYFDQPGGPVADYMSKPVETVGPDEDLVDLAVRFNKARYRRFPVVEDGRLIGVIARRDVLRALVHSAWFEPKAR